jgi:hypothetical protein
MTMQINGLLYQKHTLIVGAVLLYFCSAVSNTTSERSALLNLAWVMLLHLLLARLALPDTQADKGTQGEQAYHPPPHHFLTQP